MVDRIVSVVYGAVFKRRHRLGLYIIALPMLVLVVYYGLVATHRYVSESKVVVKSSGGAGGHLDNLMIPFLGMSGGASKEDAQHLMAFIHSPDLLQRLDKQFGLRDDMALKGLDFIGRLPPWSTREDFLKLYRERVELGFDEKTGVLTIRTQAHAADGAQKINHFIIAESEKFINNLSQQIAREQVDFANQELLHSRKGLDEAKEALLGFQNKNAVLDPMVSLEMTNRVIAELEGQLAAREVELRTLSAILQDDAAQVVSLRQTVSSLKQQLEAERKKLTSARDSGLNRMAARYVDHKSMVDFQSDVYRISLAATEKMRLEAARKVKTLAVLSSPQTPEEAEYPRRAYMLGAWLLSLIVLFGLVRLTIEIIEDHRD